MDTRGARPDGREADLMPTGQLYWRAVEPIWRKVSIYDGSEKFIRQFCSVTRAQAHLLAVHWCLSEVSNGGFAQFFYNETGVLAPESAAGFEIAGLKNGEEIVLKALSFFGAHYPRDREERNALLESAAKRKKAGGARLSLAALDRKLYAWDKKDNVAAALDQFVFRNADLFFREST